jgi:hypothetical protein
MTHREQINEIADVMDEKMIVADGFDEAIIGCTWDYKVVYDAERCVKILIEGGIPEAEAAEYFEFNVINAYVGEKTPIFVSLFKKKDTKVIKLVPKEEK